MHKPSRATFLRALASGVTALALFGAFPPFQWEDAAWLALVPLLLLARYTEPHLALRWGLAVGMAAWLSSLQWLLRLHETGIPPVPMPQIAAGWGLLSLYCAMYVAAFTYMSSRWLRQFGTLRAGMNCLHVLVLTALWVGFEYARMNFFTGFPWNPLGASQYRNLAVIQIAEWGGIYGVSALFALLNAGIALTVMRRIDLRRSGGRSWLHPELALSLFVFLGFMLRSHQLLNAAERGVGSEQQRVRVVVVQPNIEQGKKWSAAFEDMIYDRIFRLSLSGRTTRSDLVIWPETAIPGVIGERMNADFVAAVVSNGTPVLVGSMRAEDKRDRTAFYNSSILYLPGDGEVGRYDKMHLVPFGEYVPLAGLARIFGAEDPLGWSCTPGTEMVVFELPLAPRAGRAEPGSTRFSALICFEDLFPPLARRAVSRGAEFLVNQTNDAWYDHSPGALQHLANSVFRCIENRVPMVRVTNTGITCVIAPTGRITYMGNGTDTEQYTQRSSPMEFLAGAPRIPTRYAQTGDLVYVTLALVCMTGFVLALGWEWFDNAPVSALRRRLDPRFKG